MKKKKDISEVDKKEWEQFIKNPKDIFDKEQNSPEKQTLKSRFKFDLHGFSLQEANAKIDSLVKFCIEKKYDDILLITGKGIHSNTDNNVFSSKKLSKLRNSIPDYIKSHNELNKLIVTIVPAKLEDGGDGAIIIKLKKL